MKIVEIIPDITYGGAERFVVDLSNALVEKGNNVTLISFFSINEKKSFLPELSDNVKFLCLNKKKGRSFLLPFLILYYIIKEKPAVVHTHLNGLTYSILAWLFLRNVTFVHTIHNDASEEAGKSLGLTIRKIAFSGFVTPVTISYESKRTFTELYKRNSTLIFNGRPQDPFDEVKDSKLREEIDSIKSSSDTLLIVNVARFAYQKNQINLVKAINLVNLEKPIVELFLIGSYDHSQEAREIYKSIKEIDNNQIHILGARSDASLFFKFADAFCLSSIYEGMPISIIESFSNGCPVLSTPVGGIINMVQDGVNGFLSRDTSVQAIVDMIKGFSSISVSKKEQISKNAKESYELYSMKKCVDKYIACFDEL